MSPNAPPGGGSAAAPLRIVIVGAGIGGLALALALRRRGLTAAVFERAPTLRPAGAGIALGPNAMVLLDGLGVGARVAAPAGRCARP